MSKIVKDRAIMLWESKKRIWLAQLSIDRHQDEVVRSINYQGGLEKQKLAWAGWVYPV